MRRFQYIIIACCAGLLPLTVAFGQAAKLPSLNIAPNAITVSGISSGAYMAVQLHVSHSRLFSGSGSIAGGIYWCAQGDKNLALNQCMATPNSIDVRIYIKKALDEGAAGRADPLENLANDHVYIYNSPDDYVIRPLSGVKLREFYEAFIPNKDQIISRHNFKSAHGFPTLDFGSPCNVGALPWLLKCNFDAAGELLTTLYGKLNTPTSPVPSNLIIYDQTEFNDAGARLYKEGYVYIPTACADGRSRCALHVALHGCQQNPDYIKADFAIHAGYNSWAEANNIVILYPMAAKTQQDNPYGCWDWFGFTGPDYANKEGKQIRAIERMVKQISANHEPLF